MSDELFSQQKDITNIKKELSNLNNKIKELDVGIESSLSKKDTTPPHY